MPANVNWWHRQFIEVMKESSSSYEMFQKALEPNIDDFDKAITLFTECCEAYELKEITFEEFLEFGRNLRTRQISPLVET